jgi:peptidoglycan/xylan/chitin deacetylase (PgdA/CDA1 family)
VILKYFLHSLILSVSLLIACLSEANAKEIAFTFDDSPRFATGFFDGPTRAQKLIDELYQHDLSGFVFFSNPSSAGKPMNEEGKARLNAYSKAGHIIANHTYAHGNINELNIEEYLQGIKLADTALKQYPTFKKWFRFPYLREGNTLEKRDAVRQYLKELGYINGYVTADTYDWYMEVLFQKAIKEAAKSGTQIDMDKLRKFYVNTLVDNIEFADKRAQHYLGRSPKHVLLLHETDLSALFVGDLADAIRKKGWKIISTEEAYTDDIANFEMQAVYPWNPGRIGEIALESGKKPLDRPASLTEKGLEILFTEMVLE